MLRRIEGASAGLLTLFAALLCLSRMVSAGGLWRDEAAAAALATLPSLREVAAWFEHEAFLLAFPLTLRAWTALVGEGDLALRAFGLVIGLGLIAALWRNARLAGTFPLASLALVGVSSAVVQYGGAVRGYGLGSLLLLVAYGSVARYLVRPSPAGAIVAVLAGTLAAHCLLQNLALLAAIGAAAVATCLARGERRAALGLALPALVSAATLLPYVGPLAGAREWNVLVRYPVTFADVWAQLDAAISSPRGLLAWAWLPFLALGVAGAFAGGDREERGASALFHLLTLLLAPAAFWSFLELLSYTPRTWYYLPLLVLEASALDALTARAALRRPWLRGARIALALAVAAVVAVPSWASSRVRQTDMDLVAQTLERAAAPGDLVVVNPWYYGVSFARYYRGPAPWTTLPDLAEHRFHRYDLVKAKMSSPRPLAGLLARAGETLRRGGRVWLVGGARFPRPGEPPFELPPAPRSPWGWSEAVYVESWSRQLGAFLAGRALGGRAVPVAAGTAVNPDEAVPLLVVEGWRGGA